MWDWIGVGIGGFLGSVARYGISRSLAAFSAPTAGLATLAANALGCLLIGFLYQLAVRKNLAGESWEVTLRVGVLGGLTTFSSFSLEVFQLWKEGQLAGAAALFAANIFLGFLLLATGIWLANQCLGPQAG